MDQSGKRKFSQTFDNEEEDGRTAKKKKYDIAAVLMLLVDAEPDFIEALWLASDENEEQFNLQIMNYFETGHYPKKIASYTAKSHTIIDTTTDADVPKLTSSQPDIVFEDKLDVGELYRKTAEIVSLICECCFAEDIQLSESVECDKGLHTFCQDCLKKCADITIAKAEGYPKCMADCTGSFSVHTLQQVLPEKLLQSLLQQQQLEELNKAQIEGLESCPFCYFAYVPRVEDSEFVCQNSGCAKTSCRLCKKVSHAPNKCEENEDTLKVRHKIEEAMSEELICKCPSCQKPILKVTGCNMLYCVCGKLMCYICKQGVIGYQHFNLNPFFIDPLTGMLDKRCILYGGDRTAESINDVGKKVRDEELAKAPDVKLTDDPTELVLPVADKSKKR